MPRTHRIFTGYVREGDGMGIGLFGGMPEIELDGNRSIVISGACAIERYSREIMCIRCGGLLVRVEGAELELETLDAQELSITGQIAEVGFLTGRDGA